MARIGTCKINFIGYGACQYCKVNSIDGNGK